MLHFISNITLKKILRKTPNEAKIFCGRFLSKKKLAVCSFRSNFTERQVLWSFSSVDFHTLTLQLPIQTQNCVVPELKFCEFTSNFSKTSTPQMNFLTSRRGCARFAEIACELTKAWSSGATEFWVWIGNCNVKVWKSTEDKLHKIWNSKYFSQISAKRAHPRAIIMFWNFVEF